MQTRQTPAAAVDPPLFSWEETGWLVTKEGELSFLSPESINAGAVRMPRKCFHWPEKGLHIHKHVHVNLLTGDTVDLLGFFFFFVCSFSQNLSILEVKAKAAPPL